MSFVMGIMVGVWLTITLCALYAVFRDRRGRKRAEEASVRLHVLGGSRWGGSDGGSVEDAYEVLGIWP